MNTSASNPKMLVLCPEMGKLLAAIIEFAVHKNDGTIESDVIEKMKVLSGVLELPVASAYELTIGNYDFDGNYAIVENLQEGFVKTMNNSSAVFTFTERNTTPVVKVRHER